MPEIKHAFSQGKMNKDLDERLVPNGQYRNAMNVQVSTSEGADTGTLQNILGNSKISNIDVAGLFCVGSIADEMRFIGLLVMNLVHNQHLQLLVEVL